MAENRELEAVLAGCRHLPAASACLACRQLGLPAPGTAGATVSAGQALALQLANILQTGPLGGSDAVWLLLGEFGPDVVAIGDELARAWEQTSGDDTATIQVALLVLGDRRFATLTGRSGLFDLTAGRMVDSIPVQFLETISYNLTGLFVLYEQRQGSKTP